MTAYRFLCSGVPTWPPRDAPIWVFQDGLLRPIHTRVFQDGRHENKTNVMPFNWDHKCMHEIPNILTMNLSHMYGVMQVFRSCIWSAWDLTFEQGRFPELKDGESELLVRLNLPSSSFPSLFSFFLGIVKKIYIDCLCFYEHLSKLFSLPACRSLNLTEQIMQNRSLCHAKMLSIINIYTRIRSA